MVGAIRSLSELARHGGSIRAKCRRCHHVAIFHIGELAFYFHKKGWSDGWPGFAKKLKCQCGESNPEVSWQVSDPPPDDDPPPPRPRFARDAQTKGVPEEWARAVARRDQRKQVVTPKRRKAGKR